MSALGLVARGQKQGSKSPAQSMENAHSGAMVVLEFIKLGKWMMTAGTGKTGLHITEMEAHCCDPNYMDINEKIKHEVK